MARADLLITLVRSGIGRDRVAFRKTVEELISEERTKQHRVLADRLEEALRQGGHVEENDDPFLHANQRTDTPFHEVTPRKRISDLILSDGVQKICREMIEEQHKQDLLRSYNLQPRNRLLLIGPPGNGKTSLAEAIAEALFVPLIVVRYENVISSFLGKTASRLKKIFEYASTRKCVLFFDEFETLGKERGDVHEMGEIKRVVSSFLMQIDEIPSYVVVVGATNHPELLDRAVWRRFQVRIELPSPTEKNLIEWFGRFERRIRTPLKYAHSTLAKRLRGSNFAEIEEFGLTVFRQFVLAQPHADMKGIIGKTLKNWSARSVIVKQQSNHAMVKHG